MSTIVGLVGLKMEATDASDEEQNRSMCNDFSCFCSSSESVSARRRNGRRKMVSASAWGGSMAGVYIVGACQSCYQNRFANMLCVHVTIV
jgi:hypothetical protein